MANEDAVRDGNHVPTMLYEENGETRRVSTTTPLPVTGVMAPAPTPPEENTSIKDGLGNFSETLVAPAAGKRLVVKGAAIFQSKAGALATVRFQSGQVLLKTNRIENSGNFIPMTFRGNIDDPVLVEQSGAGGGDIVLFTVNTIEE